MGNAEIRGGHLPAGFPIPPPAHRVLWEVYRLRDDGEKMPAGMAAFPPKVGMLEFWRSPDAPHELNAKLWDPSGYPALESLEDVGIVRSPRAGGLLLHGRVLNVKSGNITTQPQAWWCVVHALRPVSVDPG
ncbi:hypothetical protein [uncultured Ramlibacter sp.]|uniref:hypothetical protein n=1 Tax=uncultured Ramlibacter sp. TaxID=260755 RepID=UPI002620CF47|nr:hypothetical protein [uncultured Ramlibacter sp.]